MRVWRGIVSEKDTKGAVGSRGARLVPQGVVLLYDPDLGAGDGQFWRRSQILWTDTAPRR